MSKPGKQNFSIGSLFKTTTMIILSLVAYSFMSKGCISEYQLEQISEGMTEAEVHAVLGSPVRIEGNTWEYQEGFFPFFVDFGGSPPYVIRKR